jgi:Peptidase family M50
MFDPAPRRGPLSPSEVWTCVLFLVVLLGLFAAEVVVNYTPAKLSALFFLLSWFLLLPLHEAGHAIVATLLGWHVGRVVIGMGRTVTWFHVGETLVEVRLVPIEGFVQPVPRNLRAPQLKSVLIYLAGPGAELLLLGALWGVLGTDTLLARSDNIGLLAVQSLCVAILASAFFNLVPHLVQTQSGMVPNDGLGILRSLWLPEAYYAALIGKTFTEEPEDELQEEARDRS